MKLKRLQALRHESASAEHVSELRKLLGDASNLVAAEAAEIVGARGLAELTPELVAAFGRFMVEPAESDKLCRAKFAIVETLNKIEYEGDDIFLQGIHHVQMEPRWGDPEDAAAPLRASSAFGLVRINYHDVVMLLTDLLCDKEKVARLGAVQALGESRAPTVIPLLRYKARSGDKEPEVTAECLAALMTAAPKESLPFVATFLHAANETVQEGAAFALGESRRPDALAILQGEWPRVRSGSMRDVILLAISMTRLPAAIDFVVNVLAGDNQAAALSALSALAIHRHNDTIKQRIAAVLAKTGDDAVHARFRKKFAE